MSDNGQIDFDNLSEEKKIALDKLGKRFIVKSVLTGINYGGLFLISNLAIIFGFEAFELNSKLTMLLSCVVVDIILFNMMKSQIKENIAHVVEKSKEIVDSQ